MNKPFSKKSDLSDPTPPTERGSQIITKYSPEYQFLVKLVKLVTSEGVPPQELKTLAEQNPFVTVDDVGNLAAKIWTLATEKYQIPREWLIKRLPKNAKQADLWPSQKETQDMLSHEHNSLSYNNDQEPDLSVSGPRPDEVEVESKTKKLNISKVVDILNAKNPQVANINTVDCTITLLDGTTLTFDEAVRKAVEIDKTATGEFTGAEFSGTDAQPNPLTDIGPWSSPEDHGKKDQKQPFPNTNWLPADDENKDQQPASNVAASLDKKAYDEGYWVDPNGKVYQVRNSETGFITHDDWIGRNKDMLRDGYGIEIGDKNETLPPRDLNNILISDGWTRIGDSGNADIGIRTKDLRKIPRVVEDTLYSFYNGGKISLEDLMGKHVNIKKLDQDLQKTVNNSLRVHASLNKLALAQQDVVDFYLLSLLPPEYLTEEVGPEHYDALGIFKTVIQSLRDEYIERGLHELKEEAETTKWTKAVSDENMPEHLKPYYTYHDEPFSERERQNRDDDEDSDPEFPYSCYECGDGLYEDDTYSFGDYTYCESCQGDAINKAIRDNVSYCATHHVFLNNDSDLDDYLSGMEIAIADPREHPVGPEHQIVRYREGQDIWREVQENARKQLEFKIRERKPRNQNAVTERDLKTICTMCGRPGGEHQVTGECPESANVQPWSKFTRPKQMKLPEASLKQAAEGGGWWEAPDNFDDYTAKDFYNIFQYAKWKHLYGGPLWAEVARTVVEMEKTTDWQKLVVLIDHFHDLGHNTGKLLDKFPEWHKWFKKLLDMKAEKNSLRYLLPKASGPVKNLVTEFLQSHGRSWREDEEKETKPKSEYRYEEDEEVLYQDGTPVKILNRGVPGSGEYYVKFLRSNPSGEFTKNNAYWIAAVHLKDMPSLATASLKRPFSKKAAGDDYKNVLIVCEGNTCRSPMAENILRSIRPDLNIISRGLSATSAFQMSPDAVEVLKEKNIPVQPHTSQQLTKEDVIWADLIIAMSHYMEEDLTEFYPESNGKVVTLRDADISDPVGGDIAKYRKVRDEISESLGVMASLKKQANPQTRYWIAPDGKEFEVSGIHPIWIKNNGAILKQYGIDPKGKATYELHSEMLQNGWSRISNEGRARGNGFQIEVGDLSNLPPYLDDFIAKNFNQGETVLIGDGVNIGVFIDNPFPSIQKAVSKELRNPVNASLNKQASIEEVNGIKVFINPTPEEVKAAFKKYTSLRALVDPASGDVFVWAAWEAEHDRMIRYFGLPIDWENDDGTYIKHVTQDGDIEQLFAQQLETKEKLRRPKKQKKADVSGQPINEIVNLIHSEGGVTYNLANGSLAGTNNYAVSIYPAREYIVNDPVDFDEIEKYVTANQDLLKDPDNSFGAWVNGGKVYLDIVVTIPDQAKAMELARQYNQLAIFDLATNKEIPVKQTVRAFSKKAAEDILTQDEQNAVAAASSPAYVIALNNYAQAVKRGHSKDRALEYAIESVDNLAKIDEKKLVEFINTYVK